MQTSSLPRTHFFRRSLGAALLVGGGVLALNGSLRAQTTATFTNGGTPANTGSFNTPGRWSTGVVPTSTTTTSDTANFDGTGGGATAGAPLVLTDSVVVGGGSGNLGINLNLTAGQAGGLRLSAANSVRLASATVDAGAGPLTISSVVVGGSATTPVTSTSHTFTNNSASTFTMNALQGGGTGTRNLTLAGTGNFLVSGSISGGLINVIKGVTTTTGISTDTSVLTINDAANASIFTSAVTINTGIVAISTATALGGTGTGGGTTITSGGAGGNNGVLQVSNNINVAEPFTVGSRSANLPVFENVSGNNTLSGAVSIIGGGTNYDFRSDAGTLIVSSGLAISGSTSAKTLTASGTGNVQLDGVVADGTGTLALAKTGTGTLILTNANTYSLATTVGTGGTLLVRNTTGSATGTGTLAVNSTGTLTGGSGTNNGGTLQTLTTTGGLTATRQTYTPGILGIVGTTTVSSGTIAPGDTGVGTLTVGALTLNAGTKLTYEFNATANDLISGTGTLTLSTGTNAISVTLLQEGTTTAFTTAGVYNLIKYTGGATVSTTGFSVANPVGGLSYVFSDDAADGLVQLSITGTAVPEPSTWVAGLLCVGVLGVVLRRRAAASASARGV